MVKIDFTEKGEVLPNLDWTRNVSERINIIRSLFFPESSYERTVSGLPKTIQGDTSLTC